MEIEQDNNKETIFHDKGLLKYHQNTYDYLERELDIISSAYSIHCNKIKFLMCLCATLISIGMAVSIVGNLFLGVSALFFSGTCLQGYRIVKKASAFTNLYPPYVYLLQEKGVYLLEKSSELEKEKEFHQAEIMHLQTQIVQLEHKVESDLEREEVCANHYDDSYFHVFSRHKQKKKIKKLRYHY